jgi:hypothetical protein
MQPVIDSIQELFFAVEVLGSQPDLHLGEEVVIIWRQARTKKGGRKSPSWSAWLKHLCELRFVDVRCRAGERHL